MLTYRCNLKCKYCFANDMVNLEKSDISLENLRKAFDFLSTSNNRSIGLIGGEPTIHPSFDAILDELSEDERFDSVTIYTNGIELEKYVEKLQNPKFKVLINCNAPSIIGDRNFSKLKQSINRCTESELKKRVNLGINLYQDDMDYKFIFDLTKEFGLHRLRISISVPNDIEQKARRSLDYLKERKRFLFSFLQECDRNEVVPYYDCNILPFCIWDEKEQNWISEFIRKYNVKSTNLIGARSYCFPVIDILPDLQVVRCFGMSDCSKVNISQFKELADLAGYYSNVIDSHVFHIFDDAKCKDCYERKTKQCSAGCLAFMQKKIDSISSPDDKI